MIVEFHGGPCDGEVREVLHAPLYYDVPVFNMGAVETAPYERKATGKSNLDYVYLYTR